MKRRRWRDLQQGLQPVGLPVPQVEEAVPGVVSVQGRVGALRHLTGGLERQEKKQDEHQDGETTRAHRVRHRTSAHLVVGVVAAAAELVPALGAAEVHAAAFGQRILKPAVRARCTRGRGSTRSAPASKSR